MAEGNPRRTLTFSTRGGADARALSPLACPHLPPLRAAPCHALTFRGVRFVDAQPQAQPASRVDFAQFAPGEAVLHLGGQYHAAEPTTEGCRVNLIVWLFGAHGVVRVAPYDEPAQLQPQQRWSAAASEQAAAAMAAPSWAAAKSTWADAPAREEDPEGEDGVDQAAHDEL